LKDSTPNCLPPPFIGACLAFHPFVGSPASVFPVNEPPGSSNPKPESVGLTLGTNRVTTSILLSQPSHIRAISSNTQLLFSSLFVSFVFVIGSRYDGNSDFISRCLRDRDESYQGRTKVDLSVDCNPTTRTCQGLRIWSEM